MTTIFSTPFVSSRGIPDTSEMSAGQILDEASANQRIAALQRPIPNSVSFINEATGERYLKMPEYSADMLEVFESIKSVESTPNDFTPFVPVPDSDSTYSQTDQVADAKKAAEAIYDTDAVKQAFAALQPQNHPSTKDEKFLLVNGAYGSTVDGTVYGPLVGDVRGFGLKVGKFEWNYDGRSRGELSDIVHVFTEKPLMVTSPSPDYDEIVEATMDDLLEDAIEDLAETNDEQVVRHLLFMQNWLRDRGALANDERQKEQKLYEELEASRANFTKVLTEHLAEYALKDRLLDVAFTAPETMIEQIAKRQGWEIEVRSGSLAARPGTAIFSHVGPSVSAH